MFQVGFEVFTCFIWNLSLYLFQVEFETLPVSSGILVFSCFRSILINLISKDTKLSGKTRINVGMARLAKAA